MRFLKSSVSVLALSILWAAPVVSAEEDPIREYTIDSVHSAIIWNVQHKGAGFTYGRFNQFEGKVRGTASNPESLEVELTVQTASVDSANANRDEHLRGTDFFSAAEFPTLTFKSKSAKKVSDDSVELTGDLTIRGVTREITVPVRLTGRSTDRGALLVGAKATFTIDRRDFGITYGQGSLGNDIGLIISLQANTRP
jgi:polyisoprenoid-binding protein YceI